MNSLPQTKVIGLTGGIGAGKSVVARVLRCNGYHVYDCDSRAKWLMQNDLEVKEKIIDLLGSEAYDHEGSLNKGLLSKLIFQDVKLRAEINRIVHRAVREDIAGQMNEKRKLEFIESAIMTTGGLVPFCNYVWIVDAPLEKRIERTMVRDGIPEEAIQKRIETQIDEISGIPEEKRVFIINDGVTPLLLTILKLIDKNIKIETYA